MDSRQNALLAHAREFLTREKYRPKFSALECGVLEPFFTNTDGRVFFIHSLPESVVDVLLSMYSRMKNRRGLRGMFVDAFLPQFLANSLREAQEGFGGEAEKFLKYHKIDSLQGYIDHSEEAHKSLKEFVGALSVDPAYIQKFSSGPKVKKFLSMWLDKYGHNSIARMAKLSLCCENISILAAKSLEWTRPGAGYIELSTRYVDMSGKDMYPIWEELVEFGVDKSLVLDAMNYAFEQYRLFQGDSFKGPLPQFFRDKYGKLFDEKDLESGVIGETCDVLGNFLPCATLTSVGVAVSGEAFPQLLKHLILDNTPENLVLVEMILKEAEKIGGDQFGRHYQPTEWDKMSWQYLIPHKLFYSSCLVDSKITSSAMPSDIHTKMYLWVRFVDQNGFCSTDFSGVIKQMLKTRRSEHDKLPNHFEGTAAVFRGVMSFRGWRDLHRQQLATHYRTLVTPVSGFYLYNKPALLKLFDAYESVWRKNSALYTAMSARQISGELMQYPMAMGNLVEFHFGANLSEIEFCAWQRTKFSVNHEVRQIFIGMENALRQEYPWWASLSRADMTPAYVFARTQNGTPLKIS